MSAKRAGASSTTPTPGDMTNTHDADTSPHNAWAEQHRLLTSKEVADMLSVHVSTLARWRKDGSGPPELQDALVWLSEDIPRYRRQPVLAFVAGYEQAAA